LGYAFELPVGWGHSLRRKHEGFGFRAKGKGFCVKDSMFRVKGLGIRVQGIGAKVINLVFRI
jgi:hypothetical protein